MCLEESREAACRCSSLAWLGGQLKPIKQLFFQLLSKGPSNPLKKQINTPPQHTKKKTKTKTTKEQNKQSTNPPYVTLHNSPACFLTQQLGRWVEQGQPSDDIFSCQLLEAGCCIYHGYGFCNSGRAYILAHTRWLRRSCVNRIFVFTVDSMTDKTLG